ncbi:MAG: phosphatidate cytidylyltransferase [Balneolales bacterium]
MSELTKRALFSAISAPFFLLIIWLGSWYFNVVVIVIGLFIQYEMMTMLKKGGQESNVVLTFMIGLLVMLYGHFPFPLVIGFLIFLYLIISETFATETGYLDRIMSTLFCGLYAPVALLGLILLREIGSNEIGFALTITLVLIIWGNDTMAFFGGKKFGKNKLAPSISPGKTREGFYFGFIGGLIGLFIAYFLIPVYPIGFLYALPIAIIAGFFGPAGDLAASKLKRVTGVKDSATFLPGHGGFFDRFDALLLASPAVYIYLILVFYYL